MADLSAIIVHDLVRELERKDGISMLMNLALYRFSLFQVWKEWIVNFAGSVDILPGDREKIKIIVFFPKRHDDSHQSQHMKMRSIFMTDDPPVIL